MRVTPAAVEQLTQPVAAELAEGLSRLHACCFAGVVGAAWSAHAIGTLLNTPATWCWVSTEKSQPRGLILTRAAGTDCEVLTFGVAPGFRRCGHGAALLAAAALSAEAFGLGNMVLEVATTNAPARAFYRRCGFRESGRRPGYYQTPDGRVDACLLSATVDVVLNETRY